LPSDLPPLARDLPPASPLLPDVPGYEIQSVLGRGGMGVVYRARHVRLKRQVALKMILAGACAGPVHLARFRAEAEAAARLQHPNIVQIHEIGEHDGRPYMALELCDGSLAQLVGGKPLPLRQAAELVQTLARAMHHAHERGVVHRDLKPGNVLLTDDGVPKVTDFGLAKLLDVERQATNPSEPTTRTGAILGTPSYMAPEQAQGQSRAVGPAADVYALGAILYELLTGRPPFLAETFLEALNLVVAVEPVAPSRLRPNLPRDLETICLQCLRKEARQRYASAQALADDLTRWLNGEPVLARPISSFERAVKWARRRPAWAILALVSMVSMLLLAAGLVWHNTRLRAERDEAKRARDRAVRTVDEMLTEVAEEHLADEPRTEEKRRVLLEKALQYYRDFLDEHPNDPELREQTALACRRLGDIQRLLKQPASARKSYDQAIVLLGELAASSPGELRYQQDLASCYNFLGELCRTNSQPEQAKEAYQNALRLQTALRDHRPDEPAYQQEQARTLYNLGLLQTQTSQFPEAEAVLRRAAGLLDELQSRLPDRPAYRQELARAHLNLGPVLRATKRYAQARTEEEKAIGILKELTVEHRTNPEYRHELAIAWNNLGNLLGDTAGTQEAKVTLRQARDVFKELTLDYPRVPAYRQGLANTLNSLGSLAARSHDDLEAEQALEQAVELLTQLKREHDTSADYRGDLGLAHGNLGWMYTEQGKKGLARRHEEQAIGYLKEALEVTPQNPYYRQALRNQYQTLAHLLAETDHAAAAAAARALPSVFPDRALDHYYAACFLARCIPTARNDAEAKPEQREILARQYADQAGRCLRRAVEKGLVDQERLTSEQERQYFKPLEGQEDYRRFLAAMKHRGT
jgi:serine/threonine-protein kinase